MEKFILTHGGEEVKIGDVLVQHGTVDTSLGKAVVHQEVTVTKDNIPTLIKEGVITQIHNSKCHCNNCINDEKMQIDYYINKLANKLNWDCNRTINFLDTLTDIYPIAAFNIMLREIAIEMDLKYDDHISCSPRIYVVSSLSGKITEANKAHIKNYKNFAAFRSIDDARVACRILKKILKDLYKSGK